MIDVYLFVSENNSKYKNVKQLDFAKTVGFERLTEIYFELLKTLKLRGFTALKLFCCTVILGKCKALKLYLCNVRFT